MPDKRPGVSAGCASCRRRPRPAAIRAHFALLAAVTCNANRCSGAATAARSAPAFLQFRVCARYPLPAGDKLFLRGDCCGLSWDTGLEMLPDSLQSGTFCRQLTAPAGGASLSCKPLVNDQQWSVGANVVVNAESGARFDFYPWFVAHEGAYEYIRDVESAKLGNRRDVVVYLPPSFHENTLRPSYEVLVMHDGQNLFNDSTAFGGVSWGVQQTVDALVVAGKMREVVIVGIDNAGADRINEYTYSKDPTYGGGNADAYLDFVQSEVLGRVKMRYPRADVAHGRLTTMGSSLGGLLSCYAAWTRPTVYAAAGCMSSSFWWNAQDFNTTILRKLRPPTEGKPLVVYLDSGDTDGDSNIFPATLVVRQHLRALGWSGQQNDLYYYLDRGAGHSERYWGARFHIPASSLFPPRVTAPSYTRQASNRTAGTMTRA